MMTRTADNEPCSGFFGLRTDETVVASGVSVPCPDVVTRDHRRPGCVARPWRH